MREVAPPPPPSPLAGPGQGNPLLEAARASETVALIGLEADEGPEPEPVLVPARGRRHSDTPGEAGAQRPLAATAAASTTW